MNLLRKFAAFLLVAVAMSCSKTSTEETVTVKGSWHLVTYWDKKDETSKFAAYTSFDIHEGGHMQGVRGNLADDGVWSTTTGRLTFNFGTHPVLSALNDNWLIETLTATSMKLKNDNPTADEWVLFSK